MWYYVVVEEGVEVCDIVCVVGVGFGLFVVFVFGEEVQVYFGWLGMFVGVDMFVFSVLICQCFGWMLYGLLLLFDFEWMDYVVVGQVEVVWFVFFFGVQVLVIVCDVWCGVSLFVLVSLMLCLFVMLQVRVFVWCGR